MTQRDSAPRRFGDMAPSAYPGERLGLPDKGSRSVGRVGRRILGLCIDWAIAWALTFAVPGVDPYLQSFVTLGIFAVLQIVFIPMIGGSMGHRIVGLRVVPLVGGWIGLWRPIVRTVLLCVVIPTLVWDSDQRGFHDKIAGTVLVRS